MHLNLSKKFFHSGYRRKTLLFVSLYTAIFTTFMISVFLFQDKQHFKRDDERTVVAVSKMLSHTMQLPLYAGNHEELRNLALYAIETFHITNIQIIRPDGTVYLNIPNTPQIKNITSSRAPISLSQSLTPDTASTGDLKPDEPLGIVVVSTSGAERRKELHFALLTISILGVVFWIFATYIGYLIMRGLTRSFDTLVASIEDIEQGQTETIEIELQEEALFIANSINRLSQTLHERERQNISLQQELTQQMELRAETAEQTMQAKLIHADKMSSLGMLVGCMGHEINNPNAMLRLHIEFIRQIVIDAQPLLKTFAEDEGNFFLGGYPFKEAEKMLFDSIEGAHNQTYRIERVITELRNYATADSTEKTLIGLDLAVLGTMVLLNPELKRYEGKIVNKVDTGNKRTGNSKQNYTGSDRRAKISANHYSLQQIMVNLLLNSIRATKHLGKKGMISMEILSNSDTVKFVMTDNGEGIHPDDLQRLCDPYFSRNLNSGGTGLGLFIAKQILDDHNATIEFQSELDSGTSVTITFPVIKQGEYP